MVSFDDSSINYTYDDVGRVKTLTDGTGNNIVSYDYDTASRVIKETNANGTYTTYEYDSLGQLTNLVSYKSDGTINSHFNYTYNNLGLPTSMTTLEGTFQYGYDATGQLTSVVTPTNRIIQYQYDAAGNLTTVADNGTTRNYTSNNLNQYTTVGNRILTYNADGNFIAETVGGQTSNYTYDSENRLTKVTTPQGTWNYKYDALGNLVASTTNGQTTEYLFVFFGLDNVVAEYDGGAYLAGHSVKFCLRVGKVAAVANKSFKSNDLSRKFPFASPFLSLFPFPFPFPSPFPCSLSWALGLGISLGLNLGQGINKTGTSSNDTLSGGTGNNILIGNAGDDVLTGDAGKDILTGGTGNDSYTFYSLSDKLDTITDFNVSDDSIYVKLNGFKGGLVAGDAIKANQFVTGTVATAASNRFIYNNKTGGLFYDSDGTGANAQVQLAKLDSHLALTNFNIVVF